MLFRSRDSSENEGMLPIEKDQQNKSYKQIKQGAPGLSVK